MRGRFLERVRWSRNPRLVWLGVVRLCSGPCLAVRRGRSPGLLGRLRSTRCSITSIPYAPAFKEGMVVR